MKIIQVIPVFRLAGAEIMCENLCVALKNAGETVIAVSLYSEQTAITERKYTIPLISKILFVKLSKCPLRLNISNTFWIPPSKMLLFKRYTITSITSPITPTAAEISTFLIIV